MGLSEDEDELPEHYFCEQCKPENHKGLLAAIARGERPWEEATKRREEALRKRQKKGKKGKTGRQSKAHEVVKDTATSFETRVASPTVSESNKRKLQAVALEDENEQVSRASKQLHYYMILITDSLQKYKKVRSVQLWKSILQRKSRVVAKVKRQQQHQHEIQWPIVLKSCPKIVQG